MLEADNYDVFYGEGAGHAAHGVDRTWTVLHRKRMAASACAFCDYQGFRRTENMNRLTNYVMQRP